MDIIPPPPVKHACAFCRIEFALADSPLCVSCEQQKQENRERLTQLIQGYERAFCTTFERSDEVWIKVSDTECVAVLTDPVAQNSFVADEVITLREDEYEVIFEDDDEMANVSHLADDQTCIPAPSGMR